MVRESSWRRVGVGEITISGRWVTWALMLLGLAAMLVACAGKKMTLEEAKEVSVAMEDAAFVPPPRHVNDILALLNKPGQFAPEVTMQMMRAAAAAPPTGADARELASFYHQRGRAAFELGRYVQNLEDMRKALSYARQSGGALTWQLLRDTGTAEVLGGNFARGLELYQRSNKVQLTPSNYYLMAWLYFELGDFAAGEKASRDGIALANAILARRSSRRGLPRRLETFSLIQRARLYANRYEYTGHYQEAEPYRRQYLEIMRRTFYQSEFPYVYLMHRSKLALNLAYQGRLLEAEVEIRDTIGQALAHSGRDSCLAGTLLRHLAWILARQGRTAEALEIIDASIRIFERVGLSRDSVQMAFCMLGKGQLLMSQGAFPEAMAVFGRIQDDMRVNRFFYEKSISQSPDVVLALLMNGRATEALAATEARLAALATVYPESHPRMGLFRGLRGLAQADLGRDLEAGQDLRAAMSILWENRQAWERDHLKRNRVVILMQAYLDFLGKLVKSGTEPAADLDWAGEAFRTAEALSSSRVQQALGDSSVRAAVTEPELADLVRRQQDALVQGQALEAALSNLLALPAAEQDPAAIDKVRTSIQELAAAQEILAAEIGNRFPKYRELTNPMVVSLSRVQELLGPEEALVSIYSTSRNTFVWAVPKSGQPVLHVTPLGREQIRSRVEHLRLALDPKPATLGDIPAFDLDAAYDLYRQLLQPVASGWKGAQDLLLVTPGHLGTIPLTILPTAAPGGGYSSGPLFSHYRQVPWLLRQVSTTRLPSASALEALRGTSRPEPAPRPFAGFGDPLFSPSQAAASEQEEKISTPALAASGGKVAVRGIRVTAAGSLDDDKLDSCDLSQLQRLRDTAAELSSIAAALGADPAADVFVGKRASEARVKGMDLRDRRVIAFASHALVPGDLDGLRQPAIAMSSPEVTGEGDDGLLTMEEVLRLRLNADWVVLSACNTGAAAGAGAEALSGLGRAFFYAGTRALLASMWPVETTSARKITISIFRYQKENPGLNRAQALRRAMLDLIDGPGLVDPATKQTVASYAHPLFWAPFIIVGDNGARPGQ